MKSNRKKTLKQQLVRGALGSGMLQVINRLLALVLGVILARGLGAEGYGTYSYAFAILALVMVVAELGLPTLILRHIAMYQVKKDWAHIRGLLISSHIIVFIVSTILALITILLVTKLEMGITAEQRWTIIFVMALLPFLVVTKLMVSAIQSLQHVVKSQTVGVFRLILVIILMGLVFYFYPEMRAPKYAVATQLIATIVALFLAAGVLYRYLPQQVLVCFAQYQSRQWVVSALPLVLIGGANIINNQVDILMLGYFRSSEEIGIYRIAVQGAALVSFGLQAINSVVAPQFARLYAQNDLVRLQKIVTKSARVTLLLALPTASVFVISGGVLAGLVFGEEFTQSHLAMAILATGQLVSVVIGSVGFLLNMTGHEKDVARTLFITSVLNIILNLFLIPLYGMDGAALATAVSLVLQNFTLYTIVKKRIGINSMAFYFSGYVKGD